MANEQNLRPGEYKFTKEDYEKSQISRQENAKRKQTLRECFEILLEKQFKNKDGTMFSGAEAIAMKQFEKAMKGDTRAFETVRDTAGQKPVDKVMISEVSQEVIEEVEKMVLSDDEE